MTLTNITGISLPIAVWLAADGYDFNPQGRSISATALLKPVRQILLRERLTPDTSKQPDVSDFIASRLGHSIHDGIDRAWNEQYAESLKLLGYPQKIIDRFKINPREVSGDDIPVYLEQRAYRDFMGYRISGKFDMILGGEIQDFKSTSVYSWLKGSKDEDYRLQGSIYRWLNPEKVTSDFMCIQFVFTDWQKSMARSNPDYPQQRVKEHRLELLSLEETEAWIARKFQELEAAADLDEAELPFCSDEDLWRGDTVWKYYSDPTRTNGRATKNFDNAQEAQEFHVSKGKGVVIEVPGQVKACSYCPAFPICSQKDLYDHG